jgi:hypothetical protein
MKAELCVRCHEPTGRAGKGDDSLYLSSGAGPFCQTCFDAATAPPTLHPFNLARALAGEEVRTREDGHKVENFSRKEVPTSYAFQAWIDGVRFTYNELGEFLRKGTHPLDLFMAREAAADPDVCPHCCAGYFLPSGVCDHCNLRRDEKSFHAPTLGRVGDHSSVDGGEFVLPAAETEIDRQIEVMRASNEAGVVVERCCAGCQEHINAGWSVHAQGQPFNWQSYFYRVKTPAPEKARRVFVMLTKQGIPYKVCSTKISDDEFIELTPAIRAVLEEKGMM